MNYPLAEAELPIREALERLVDKNERRQPFVLVIKVGDPELFVRCAKRRGGLHLDVPKLGIADEEIEPFMGSVRTVTMFALEFGVRDDERVLVCEEEGKPRKAREPFWARLFA